MTFENKNRIADIRINRDGEFEAFIGFKDSDFCSGMHVMQRKTYKRQNMAVKFCENWING